MTAFSGTALPIEIVQERISRVTKLQSSWNERNIIPILAGPGDLFELDFSGTNFWLG
jgi:hypothetical protein